MRPGHMSAASTHPHQHEGKLNTVLFVIIIIACGSSHFRVIDLCTTSSLLGNQTHSPSMFHIVHSCGIASGKHVDEMRHLCSQLVLGWHPAPRKLKCGAYERSYIFQPAHGNGGLIPESPPTRRLY